MDGATPYRTPPGKDPCSSDTFATPPLPPRRTPHATKTDHPESNVLSVTACGTHATPKKPTDLATVGREAASLMKQTAARLREQGEKMREQDKRKTPP